MMIRIKFAIAQQNIMIRDKKHITESNPTLIFSLSIANKIRIDKANANRILIELFLSFCIM
ncbi:hypothetical protein B0A65_04925 [Flavobacterium frigidimaris]|uniref:Uncharacterized protein n=1 Tax=Flavobacterium frigidimaris TaxID=262320 RepID=A0ABX4BV31_FLAFR|nr:hypothetical protein B0A65_04925 [Flavobacterium frigidimaris]